MEDKLIRDSDPIGGRHSGITSSTLSYNPTSHPALVFALIPALVPTPVPTTELLKQFMKAYLKSNQGSRQPLVQCEQIFKAKVSEVYYGKLHIDYYHFCQQC